jgi:hypothetical protein
MIKNKINNSFDENNSYDEEFELWIVNNDIQNIEYN